MKERPKFDVSKQRVRFIRDQLCFSLETFLINYLLKRRGKDNLKEKNLKLRMMTKRRRRKSGNNSTRLFFRLSRYLSR